MNAPNLLAAACLPLLAACAGTRHSLGRLPQEFPGMFQQTAPGETIELTLAGDGEIVGIETTLSPDRVPAELRERFRETFPDATLHGTELELDADGAFYELQGTQGGRGLQAIFAPASLALQTHEVSIEAGDPVADTPAFARLLATAQAALGGGTLASADFIFRNGEARPRITEAGFATADVVHIKLDLNGATYKMILRGGEVVATAQEMAAEIEMLIR